ncbi:hypothetical protein T484DRAFT_1794751 [Baffinella frigidus]|nr:hypothetical protein T484DRAFT_1794751 [Cryptophyta sp. CCMP2293]
MGKKRERESVGAEGVVPGGDSASSMFTEVRAQVSLKLMPERIADVDGAVRKELSAMLLRLDHHLGGVPVTFSKVKILDSSAPLFDDHPQILIDVAADFLLFAPQPGQTISGVVNNVADDSLGLLILDTFNAVIPIEQLSKSFRYDAPNT